MAEEVQPVKNGIYNPVVLTTDNYDVGAIDPEIGWVSPDVVAAQNGEKVEMGKELVDTTHRPEDFRED